MNIWFDLTNAPHINFFESMIEELQQQQHTIIITARDHSNTVNLLNASHLPYTLIGKHYGKQLYKKVYGFFDRVFALHQFLKGKKIDIAISHSSFYSPLVARMLGCPSIYLNDNEHALGNIPAFLFATKILIPEILDINTLKWQGASKRKTVHYPGLKEAIYLQKIATGHRSTANSPQKIYVRPEPWNAQYYSGGKAFLDPLLKALSENFQIVVLPRGKNQAEHYLAMKSDRITVVEESISLADVYRDCALFIGAGGTMTREMAILGVPTISVYQDKLLAVDKYLIHNNFMLYDPEPSIVKIQELLRLHQRSHDGTLIKKGVLARQQILTTLQAIGNSREQSKTR